jgi:intraflagellar transport protein 81
LAPIIQELRTLRQTHQELETEYTEKKRVYDAALVGIENDVSTLDQQVKQYREDVRNDQSKFHQLNCLMKVTDVAQEKGIYYSSIVMGEMKSYIGGDEMIEMIQKTRGFKSYRDLYNKKIMEQEHFTKALRETQKEVKVI